MSEIQEAAKSLEEQIKSLSESAQSYLDAMRNEIRAINDLASAIVRYGNQSRITVGHIRSAASEQGLDLWPAEDWQSQPQEMGQPASGVVSQTPLAGFANADIGGKIFSLATALAKKRRDEDVNPES